MMWLTKDNPQYPQTIEIELQQDKVDMLNNVAVGAEVVLYLNLRGREWTSKEGRPGKGIQYVGMLEVCSCKPGKASAGKAGKFR